jgi:hypothetical protein
LYEDCNYQGPSTAITRLGAIDLWEFSALGIRNDAVSSIKVAPGYEVQIFEDGGYSGRHLTLRNNVACLSNLEQSMDDLLSSMLIRQSPVVIEPGELSEDSEHQHPVKRAPGCLTASSCKADRVGIEAFVKWSKVLFRLL